MVGITYLQTQLKETKRALSLTQMGRESCISRVSTLKKQLDFARATWEDEKQRIQEEASLEQVAALAKQQQKHDAAFQQFQTDHKSFMEESLLKMQSLSVQRDEDRKNYKHKIDRLGTEWKERLDKAKLKRKSLEEERKRLVQRQKEATQRERKDKQEAKRALQALKRTTELQAKDLTARAAEYKTQLGKALGELDKQKKHNRDLDRKFNQRLDAARRAAEQKEKALTLSLNQLQRELQSQTRRAARAEADAQKTQAMAPAAVRQDLLEGAYITSLSQEQLLSLQVQLSRLLARIPEELTKRKVQIQAKGDEKMCVVCLDASCSILFLPCRHMKTCAECSAALSTCPMCRARIEQKINVFL